MFYVLFSGAQCITCFNGMNNNKVTFILNKGL